ncbi:MAG: hypothetical protein AABY47_03420 [Pseudomonadota bacterium]
MKNKCSISGQRGATLMVGLIMLVVITLLMISAFTLSGSNLKAVGNMQFRNEAIAAANLAIEQTINLNYSVLDPASYPSIVNIDIDQDNTDDYAVTVKAPTCMRVVPAPLENANLSGVNGNVTNTTDYLTLWEIEATAVSQATGASVIARQGINKRYTQAEYLISTCI